MVVNRPSIITAQYLAALSTTPPEKPAPKDSERLETATNSHDYLSESYEKGTIKDIFDTNTEYFVLPIASENAVNIAMQSILTLIRENRLSQDSQPAKDFLTICACVLNAEKATSETKIKAAILLGEYYTHYGMDKEAKLIYDAVATGKFDGLSGIRVFDDRRDTPITVVLSEKLAGVPIDGKNAAYSLQATARHHDLINRGVPDRAKLTAAINAITDGISNVPVTRENKHVFEEVYTILAKLHYAAKDYQKAEGIANMLLGKTEANPVTGKAEDNIEANIPYFKKTAEYLLYMMGKGGKPSDFIGNEHADPYMQISVKHDQAEAYMRAGASSPKQNRDNMERAKALFFEVLRSPAADPDMRVYAAMNYATLLMNADKDAQTAKQIAEALAGNGGTVRTRSGLVIIPKANNADVAAQAGILIQRADLAISGKAAAPQAAAALGSILAQSGLGKYTYETASLELADIYAASADQADKAKALGMYSELLGVPGSSPTGLVKAPIAGGNTYNILRAKLGRAQTLANLDVEIEQAKALFSEVLAANKTDEAMQVMATLGLAELLVREPANAPQAEAMFTSVINGNNDSYTTDRARLGLQRAVLAQPEKCDLATKAGAVQELQGIASRWDTDRLGQTALLEIASILSENAETREEAAKIYALLFSSEEKDIAPRARLESAIIATASKDQAESASAAAYLSKVENLAGLAPFFRQKAALALGNYYSKNKETEKALGYFNAVISSSSDVFLKASALIGRGNLLGGKRTDSDRRSAFADFDEALTLITASNGSVPGGYRMLEILANKGLANIADVAPDIASDTDIMSREALTALYKESVGKTVHEDRYMEADIALGDLDRDLNNWHHKIGRDRAASGRLVNGYKAIIDGDFDEMTKNTARVHLARALQTMGQPEEAEKVLAHTLASLPEEHIDPSTGAVTVTPGQISEIDLAEVFNNYGFIALGESDFNLGYEYFKRAAEFDQDSPNSIIYRARAAFLTEKFTKEHFTSLYNDALDKVGGTNRPSLEEMAQAALSEDKTALNAIASTPEGRFMVLTALEAQAKILYAEGNSLRSVQCFEQAKRLFEMWKGSGSEMLSDYLFEYQLHYDLATAYLSLSRFKDAYNEYKLIANMPGVPNWFIKDQLNVLDPEKITVTASDNGNIDLAYRRYFERGSFGIRISEDGASADTYLLLGEDKSHAVKVRFGAFNHGVIDAGVGYSKDFGKLRVSAGADYYRHSNGNEVIGINAAADFKVNRHLTLTLDGKYEWHTEDVDFGTYEVGVGASYNRRIGKDTTFSGRVRFAYGTQRDYSASSAGASNSTWLTQFQSSATGESDWRWEDDNASCYTINSGSDEKFRQRYWLNYRVYDLMGNPMSAWHISTAIDPQTRTVKVATPVYGQLATETIDVPLNDLFIQGFAHMEGSSVVFNDSRNAILTNSGQRPTDQEINSIDVDTLGVDSTKPRVQIHQESHTVSTSTTEYRSVTTITVYGQDRITREDAEGQIIYPQETDAWGEKKKLYTLQVTTTQDPLTGRVEKIVTMNNKLLYKGGDVQLMNRKVKAAIEEYYKLDLYAGITKKFHGGALPDGTEMTLSGMLSVKHTPGKARTDGNNNYTPAKNQYDLTMGPNLDVRVPAGNGYFNAGVGYIYNGTKRTEKNDDGFIERKWAPGSGWNPEAYIGYTANLSGNNIENGTYVNASASTSVGPYVGISRGAVNAGIGLEGPQVGFNAHLKVGDTQVLGDIPISISATGVNIAGLPLASAINPLGPAAGSLAKAIGDTRALNAIEKEKTRLENEIADAQNTDDRETAAYLRFIYDNLFIQEGSHQANWLKNSTRIPILNLLTALTGTRARKNAGSIMQESREITGHFSALGEIGAFEVMSGGSLSDGTREAIRQYLDNKTDYQGEHKGNVTKIADAQDKVVRGILTPFRLAGKALNLTAEKPEEGCVSESSFKAATRKKSVRRQIVEELALGGFIDPETGRVDERVTSLSGPSALGLSEDLKDKEEIIFNILLTAYKDTRIGTTQPPAAPESDPELVQAFNRKLHEDAMYLVYRIIAERGSNPEIRREIAAILATLPENVRTDIGAFMDNLPAEVMFREDKTVRVAVERETGKDTRIKVTPETYTRAVMQGESYAGKLEIEKAAVEEFKKNKPSVADAYKSLKDALAIASILHDDKNNANLDLDNDKVNDAVYKAAITLFMLAATDDDAAIDIGRAMKDGIKVGEEIIEKLNDQEKAIIMNGIANKDAFKVFGNDSDLVWNKLVTAGYIFENGVIANAFKSVTTPQDLRLDLDDATRAAIINLLKNSSGLNDNIADFILNRRPGATKFFGGQRDVIRVVHNELKVKDHRFTVREYVELSIAGILDDEIAARIRAKQLEEEMREAAHSRTRHGEIKAGNRRSLEKPAVSEVAPEAQETADVGSLEPVSQAKRDERRPVVEVAKQDNKEAEKAAKAERIRKAQERYGVGTHRSRRR